MSDDTVDELTERFSNGEKPLEPDVVAEMQSIMRLHQLGPQDLFFKWESYCIKMDRDGMQLSMPTLRAFKQDLQDALERSNRATQPQLKSDKRMGATPRAVAKSGTSDVFGMIEGMTTTGALKANRGSAKKRAAETPNISRVKANPAGSSPDYKSGAKLDDQLNALGVLPYVSFWP